MTEPSLRPLACREILSRGSYSAWLRRPFGSRARNAHFLRDVFLLTLIGPLRVARLLQFNCEPDSTTRRSPPEPRAPDASAFRVVRGATVLAISGSPKDACFQVVSTLIQSLRG